jgi:hypothetical protein
MHVWHAREEGDLREYLFTLPRLRCPSQEARGKRCGECRVCAVVDNEIRWRGKKWIDWLAGQGMAVVLSTVIPHGPYPSLDLAELDMDTYVISARVKREKPLELSLEKAEELFQNQPYEDARPGVRHIFKNLTPEMVEQQARANAEAAMRAPKQRALAARIAEKRRARGAPVYDVTEEEPPPARKGVRVFRKKGAV